MKPKPVLALIGCGDCGVHILRDLVHRLMPLDIPIFARRSLP